MTCEKFALNVMSYTLYVSKDLHIHTSHSVCDGMGK